MKKRLLPVIIALVFLMGCGKKDAALEDSTLFESSVIEMEESSSETTDEAAADTANEVQSTATATTTKTKDTDKTKASDNQTDKAAASESSKDAEAKNTDKADASASASTSAQEKEPESAPAEEAPKQSSDEIVFADDTNQTAGYGRMIFTGDSRTVDMFYWDRNEIWGEVHDSIPVFCRDACQSDYMINAVNSYGIDNFDTLVTWMGCNDYGNFAPYETFYNSLLSQGKKIVVCTVGPTDNNTLANDFDREYYTNDRQVTYNNSLVSWAGNHGVKVIDLYSYISSNGDLYISPEDGIHYMPQPTSAIWYYILSALK